MRTHLTVNHLFNRHTLKFVSKCRLPDASLREAEVAFPRRTFPMARQRTVAEIEPRGGSRELRSPRRPFRRRRERRRETTGVAGCFRRAASRVCLRREYLQAARDAARWRGVSGKCNLVLRIRETTGYVHKSPVGAQEPSRRHCVLSRARARRVEHATPRAPARLH